LSSLKSELFGFVPPGRIGDTKVWRSVVGEWFRFEKAVKYVLETNHVTAKDHA
jgi:hypothetical protein